MPIPRPSLQIFRLSSLLHNLHQILRRSLLRSLQCDHLVNHLGYLQVNHLDCRLRNLRNSQTLIPHHSPLGCPQSNPQFNLQGIHRDNRLGNQVDSRQFNLPLSQQCNLQLNQVVSLVVSRLYSHRCNRLYNHLHNHLKILRDNRPPNHLHNHQDSQANNLLYSHHHSHPHNLLGNLLDSHLDNLLVNQLLIRHLSPHQIPPPLLFL